MEYLLLIAMGRAGYEWPNPGPKAEKFKNRKDYDDCYLDYHLSWYSGKLLPQGLYVLESDKQNSGLITITVQQLILIVNANWTRQKDSWRGLQNGISTTGAAFDTIIRKPLLEEEERVGISTLITDGAQDKTKIWYCNCKYLDCIL